MLQLFSQEMHIESHTCSMRCRLQFHKRARHQSANASLTWIQTPFVLLFASSQAGTTCALWLAGMGYAVLSMQKVHSCIQIRVRRLGPSDKPLSSISGHDKLHCFSSLQPYRVEHGKKGQCFSVLWFLVGGFHPPFSVTAISLSLLQGQPFWYLRFL